MNPKSIKKIEDQLLKLVPFSEVIGTAVVNRNGLLILSRFPRTIDPRKIAAMSATIYEAMINAVDLINQNKISNLLVEFDKNQLLILEIDQKNLLLALVEIDVNIGLILIELEDIVNELNL